MLPSSKSEPQRSSLESEEGYSNESSREKSEDTQEGETVIDLAPSPVPVRTRIPVPAQPPPWFEWSDDVINEETWDIDTPEYDYFEDTFSIAELLRSKAYRWMRPSDVFPSPPSVVRFKTRVLDLISPNAHLFEKSEAMRYILSEISELYEYGLQNKFECEGEGVAYVPNYADDEKRWTPWSHIYSCCKAGVKGEIPVYNPKGKYYVRLYFMGSWRRIMVDDRIPVLHSGLTALPLTSLNELWPLILTKALLKVAMATFEGNDVKRFSTTSALTGWVFEWVDNIEGMPEEDLWNDLEGLLPKFRHPSRIPSAYNMTAPQLAREKKSKTEAAAGETFWWMPALTSPPADLNDVAFKDFEREPLKQVENIVTAGVQPESSEAATYVEYIWKNKADLLLNKYYRNDVRIKSDSHSSTKRKKPDLDALNADTKSDKKKLGKKSSDTKRGDNKSKKADNKEKEKEKEREREKAKKKARFIKLEGDEPKTDNLKGSNDPGEEEEDEDEDEEEEKDVKPKPFKNPMKHWFKLKDILLGDPDTHVQASARKSRSVPKALKEKVDNSTAKNDGADQQNPSVKSTVQGKWVKREWVLPSIPEMLHGVQKYSGSDSRILKNWESICGKDSPISLIVVLKCFPKPEDDGIPPIPSFLEHPIQLAEVRDTSLPKQTGRPVTPLWKRFRWKAWAMRKGLIPYEEDHSKDIVHAVKGKTPFVFKRDWYEFWEKGYLNFDEYPGEDDDLFDSRAFMALKNATELGNAILPPQPLTSYVDLTRAKGGETGGGGRGSGAEPSEKQKRESDSNTLIVIMPPKGSHSHQSAAASKRKTGRMTAHQTKAAQQASPTVENQSSSGNNEEKEKAETEKGTKVSTPPVLENDTVTVRGESEDEAEEGTPKASQNEDIMPTSSCGTMWFTCNDVAQNLRKICKFYPSKPTFGSCYILRREVNHTKLNLDPTFQEIHSNLPKYPSMVTEYNQKPDQINVNIDFDRWKSYHVTNYHLNGTHKHDIDSAFYLFSDNWTEQELIISVFVLQEEFIKRFTAATATHVEQMPVPPPTPNVLGSSVSDDNPTSPSPPKTQNLEPPQPQLQDSKLIMNLNFILEPWDWRKDCCLAQPLIYTSIQDHWIVHVRLPAGRNIFRLWLVPQSNPPEQDPANDSKRKFAVPFSVRVVSQTPIYIGSRIEVQNYMTNPPMLFLKQCERLANNIWGLFACFGKQRNEYHKNLKQLRRTYCPAYPEPDTINKFTKATHDTFEQLFVSLITFLNGGTLDRMLILALRVIFLNPMIGRQFMPKVEENSLEAKVFEGVLKTLGRKAKTMVYSAVITIQKFYRGWRVRRLFRLRDKYDPKFKKIEYCVRRIGFLLARESDSIYSHEEPNDKKVESSRSANKPPNIFPTPPHWAADMLRYLIEQNPWLITMHPHAYCVPHHIQLQEMEGEVPPDMKNFSWFPFLRETLRVPPNAKSCFCEIDLQAYPYTGISMKIINNDTGKLLTLRNNSLFLGHIANNKRGYTVFCYRWTVPNAYQDANERFPSKLWKLRVVSPYTESVPRFVADADDEEGAETPKRSSDAPVRTWRTSKESQHSNISDKENAEENDNENDNVDNTDVENVENEFPHKLCLRRLEGYYMPSKDASVCRYILETEEKKCTISLRFRASHAKARVRVQVWDCSKKSLIFEETCDGGLLVPCIQLHVTKKSGCTLNLAYDSSESLREDWSRGDLVSCSGLLTLEKKSSSAENEDENEEEEEEEQKMEEETEQQKEEETLDIPDPDPGNGGNLKRRYVISVYVVDDSWQLTDNEWLFVLDKKREFFRDLTRWYSRNCEVRRRGTEKNGGDDPLGFDEEAGQHVNVMDPSNTQDLEATNTEIIGPTSQPSESTDKPKEKEKPDFISNKRKKTRAEKSLKEKVEKDKEREKIEKEKNEKMDGGDSKDAAQLSDHTHYTVLPDHQPAAPPPTAAYPLINTTSSAATVPVSPVEQLDDKEGKIRRRGSGNLLIKYGGRQSQDIKQLDKPYWILEVLLDANVKYKMKSNRHQFRKKFLRAQESWTKECTAAQEPPAGAANTVDELANANNNAEMANIYECVCPEDEDYNGFANQGVMNPSCCYKKVETQPKKTAGSNSEEGDEEEHQDPAPQEHGEAVMDLGFERRQTADMADMKSEKPGKDKKKLLASKSKYVEGAAASKKKIPEQSEKPGGNRKKKGAHSIYKDDDIDKEPSAPITTQPEEVPPPPPPPETVEEEEPKPEIPEPEDPLTEQETVRLKRCGVVGEILKCYAELFMQTIPVREELLEMVKKNQLETKGPKKLVLTKTGVGKYCQKLFHMENKTKTREAIVAEKLLKWAFEYFCLEPTEENCEPNEDDTGDKVTLFLH